MNATISALAIAVIAAISGSPAHGAVILIDFQQALNSDEIKKALGDDVAFYLSGATTPTIQKTFQAVSDRSTTVRGSGTPQKTCLRVLLKVLQSFQNQARRQGGNSVVNIISDYRNKEVANSSTIECYTGDVVMGHVTLKGMVAVVDK